MIIKDHGRNNRTENIVCVLLLGITSLPYRRWSRADEWMYLVLLRYCLDRWMG